MSSPRNESFESLLDRVRAGDEQAASVLVRTYGVHVIRAIRRTIRREIRSKFDSLDFAQLVWASVFASRGRLAEIHEPAQLIGWLTSIARHKVIDENRRRTRTDKHTVRRERSLRFDETGQERIPARQPTPSEIAMARERWQRLLTGCPARDRKIAQLKLAGRTNRSIAVRLDLNERTVRRVLERLKQSG